MYQYYRRRCLLQEKLPLDLAESKFTHGYVSKSHYPSSAAQDPRIPFQLNRDSGRHGPSPTASSPYVIPSNHQPSHEVSVWDRFPFLQPPPAQLLEPNPLLQHDPCHLLPSQHFIWLPPSSSNHSSEPSPVSPKSTFKRFTNQTPLLEQSCPAPTLHTHCNLSLSQTVTAATRDVHICNLQVAKNSMHRCQITSPPFVQSSYVVKHTKCWLHQNACPRRHRAQHCQLQRTNQTKANHLHNLW